MVTPLNPLSSWGSRSEFGGKTPKAKYFIVYEGAKTERHYFEALAKALAEKNIPAVTDLKPVLRTGEDEDCSNPRKLYEYVCKIRRDEDELYGFDSVTDETVMVFDLDIYNRRSLSFCEDMYKFSQGGVLAVTNPSFELYLLLHKKDSYEKIITHGDNEQDLLINKKAGSRRFADRLFSKEFGINPKSSREVRRLVYSHEIAEIEERNLNRSIPGAMDHLTSNVGEVILAMKEERIEDLRVNQRNEIEQMNC